MRVNSWSSYPTAALGSVLHIGGERVCASLLSSMSSFQGRNSK
jgi:hypothetical protein